MSTSTASRTSFHDEKRMSAADQHAHQGVDRIPSGREDDRRGHDRADRPEQVRQDVQVRAAQVQAVRLMLAQPERDEHVHQQARGRDHEHAAGAHRLRRVQARPRLPDDAAPPGRRARPRSPARRGSRRARTRTSCCRWRAAPTPRARTASSASAATSVSMCAASVSNARLFVHQPPTSSATQSTELTARPIRTTPRSPT